MSDRVDVLLSIGWWALDVLHFSIFKFRVNARNLNNMEILYRVNGIQIVEKYFKIV